MTRGLVLASALGCATAVTPSQEQAVLDQAELVSGDPALGSAEYALHGVQIPPLQPPEDLPELQGVLDAVQAQAAECPDLNTQLMWVDCGQAPCQAYLWGVPMVSPPSWEALSCDEALGGQYIGHAMVGGQSLIEAAVYAIYPASAPPQALPDVNDLLTRLTEVSEHLSLYDEVIAQAVEVYGVDAPEH